MAERLDLNNSASFLFELPLCALVSPLLLVRGRGAGADVPYCSLILVS